MTVGVIGLGEVGRAVLTLAELAGHDVAVSDLASGRHDHGTGISRILHVCVPAQALGSLDVRPRLAIVHSTVAPGRCRRLAERWACHVVHAPVRGRHPHLARSLRTFEMPVGGPAHAASEAVSHLRGLGIPARAVGAWETTELAKVMCTTRLGLDVLFLRHVRDLCERYGADFDEVYGEWTRAYNAGYRKMGDGRFVRPVLEPQVGVIGGHCVLPNADLMRSESWAAEMVAEEGRREWSPRAPSPVTSGA